MATVAVPVMKKITSYSVHSHELAPGICAYFDETGSSPFAAPLYYLFRNNKPMGREETVQWLREMVKPSMFGKFNITEYQEKGYIVVEVSGRTRENMGFLFNRLGDVVSPVDPPAHLFLKFETQYHFGFYQPSTRPYSDREFGLGQKDMVDEFDAEKYAREKLIIAEKATKFYSEFLAASEKVRNQTMVRQTSDAPAGK